MNFIYLVDFWSLSMYVGRQCRAEIKMLYGNMVKNYLGWRCKYCNTQKGGGGATRLKQHLANCRVEVVHCRHVPPNVGDYFQRDLDRAKKATTARA
jgi:hypothetical protein